jgi:hypothetical protein
MWKGIDSLRDSFSWLPAPGQTLIRVLDFHVHSDPDSVARSIDTIDLASSPRAAAVCGGIDQSY